jgi:glutathione S-transferase
LEADVVFSHEIIDLERKPAEFLRLSPTGKVPLLVLDDGECVSESVVVARRIATEFAPEELLPTSEVQIIDAFVELWTQEVEPAYYSILTANTEPEARRSTAAFLEVLSKVEDAIFQRRLYEG